MGATLYILRHDQLLLAGFFSARLRKHQVTWLPCEVEALSIATAVNHFAPYIIQAAERTHVLTDSRPCVLAYNELCRGEFSNSARVTSFLSTASRYQVVVGHIAGSTNLPSDYASRNPVACQDSNCQICSFVSDLETSVVRTLSVTDVTDGAVSMPFTNRPAWVDTQRDCPDLRRVHAHLKQGTRPQRKATSIPDVKRYLQVATIAPDGLLVVKEASPFHRCIDRIIIPKQVLLGLLTALHIKFSHPSAYQLKRLVSRYFFAINFDKAIEQITTSCSQCTALRSVSSELRGQTTFTPPQCVGISFSLDVLRRYKQCVVVLRETVTSYTFSMMVERETSDELSDAIMRLCADIRNLGDLGTHIRVDPAPGLVSAICAERLGKYGIFIEPGRAKNKKQKSCGWKSCTRVGVGNPQDLTWGGPHFKIDPSFGHSRPYSRIRQDGLSSREMWTQRDQVTGEKLPLDDRTLIKRQLEVRESNHDPSSRSKAPRGLAPHGPTLKVGDLVYIKQDWDKTRARDKYLVASTSERWCQVRKFTRDQFRKKVYDVLTTDCIPIGPPMSTAPFHDSIRGLHNDGDVEDSDTDPYPVTTPHNNAPNTPWSIPPPEILTRSPTFVDPPFTVTNGMNEWHCRPPDTPPVQDAPAITTTGSPTPRPPDAGTSAPGTLLNAPSPSKVVEAATATIGPPPRWSSRPHAGLPGKFDDFVMY